MLDRPARPHPARPAGRDLEVRRAPDIVGTLPVAAVTAAGWAAAVGLVVVGVLVMLGWAVSGRGDDGITTPLGASGVAWLAAHHAPVETPSGAVITLLPLALLALPLALLQRAGRWAARITGTDTAPDAALVVVAGTATYGALGFLVAQASSLGGASVPPLPALGWSVLLAGVGLTWGVLSGAGMLRPLLDRLPERLLRAGTVACAAGAVVVMGAGLLAVVALATRWSTVTGLTRSATSGPVEAVELLLVSLAYLPNLLVWAVGYLAGPGFAAGGGATIDPFSVTGALLPGVPVLGAVPSDAPVAAPLLLLVPVVAGCVAALVLRRHHELSLVDELVDLLCGAVLLGVVTAWACALGGGSLGQGRLDHLGPAPLVTGLAVAGLTLAGAALAALVLRLAPTLWVHDGA